MCGIFGYAGKDNASERIINGLKRLEYRGYDSWGIAVKNADSIELIKSAGKIGDIGIEDLSKGGSHIGIGHTRWATHGGVTEVNAHPHFSTDKSFVLAQNGIVENYQELKHELIEKGYQFISQTDTEVIVRLIEEELTKLESNDSSLREAIRNAFLQLKGRNTIIILDNNSNHIVAVRNGSPLVLGLTDDEVIIASDTLSFADRTNHVALIENFQMIEYIEGKTTLRDIKTNEELPMQLIDIDQADVKVEKEGYEHFMLKEIVEQRYTINEATHYTEEELAPFIEVLRNARRIYTVGAGTAGFAAMQIAYLLRTHAGLDATELKAYEMESYRNLFTDKDILIAVSQSGETADTIEAIEYAKESGTKIASIVNMLGSSITRMSDYPFFSRSGPEICVASTKAFTAQVAWGLLLSLSYAGKFNEAKDAVTKLSSDLQEYFKDNNFEDIKELAKILKNKEHFFILGKGQNYVISLEGALKIKEITYKHFEGFPAGELKHGVIALIEEGTPVFGIISEDGNKADMLSALAEVKSRGAYVIGVSNEQNELFDYHLHTLNGGYADPIAKVIPFQLLSYFLALELGNSPDKPRNLAKSVTVK
jgi:glucosamine--fructose-6-phosphate aminotransferase (isomerizing)